MNKLLRCYRYLIFIYLFSAVQIISQPKIYIVRHSEKIENWQADLIDFQPLSEAGVVSSKRLSEYFKNINLSAIFSSKLTRTLQTAYPVSESKGLDIKIEDACNDTSLINLFINNLNETFNKDESILIISHSNIIPYFLIQLGLKEYDYERMGIIKKENWLLTDYYGYIFVIEQNETSNNIQREKY